MSATPSDEERALGERVDAAGCHGESAKVVALMRAHPASAYVQLCGLFNLAQLVQGPKPVARAAERGGAAEVALSALRAFSADAGVAGNACCALGNLIVTSVAAREQLVAAGVVADIVGVLRDHASDSDNAAPTSMHALAMLSRLPEHARIVADLGAAQLTLAAMQAHPESAGVQSKGSTLIGNLVVQQVVPAAVATEALQPVLRALQLSVELVKTADDEEDIASAATVATDALFCLESMLVRDKEEETTCPALVGASGIEAVLEALRAHSESEAAHLHGLRALLLMCINSGERQRRARDDGAIAVAQAAMETFAQTRVAMFALQLLHFIADAAEADIVTPAVVSARSGQAE